MNRAKSWETVKQMATPEQRRKLEALDGMPGLQVRQVAFRQKIEAPVHGELDEVKLIIAEHMFGLVDPAVEEERRQKAAEEAAQEAAKRNRAKISLHITGTSEAASAKQLERDAERIKEDAKRVKRLEDAGWQTEADTTYYSDGVDNRLIAYKNFESRKQAAAEIKRLMKGVSEDDYHAEWTDEEGQTQSL